jgi:beta-galactosidase
MAMRQVLFVLFAGCFLVAGGSHAEGSWEQSLDGDWRFLLVSPEQPGPDLVFARPDFDCSGWATIPVPGNWEMFGFEKFRYDTPTDRAGLYRTTFRLPRDWQRRHTLIRFDAVSFGFEFWINGKPAGSHAGAFTPSQFDISSYVLPDRDNILAVRVSKRSHGYEFDCHDDWALSGIFRDVTLLSRTNRHVRDLSVVTTAGDPAVVRVRTEIAAFEGSIPRAGLSVHGELCTAEGTRIGAFDADVPEGGVVVQDLQVNAPRLWTAETPYLYTLAVSLRENGRILEEVHRAVGIRTVSIENGVLLLNGAPIKLHGVDRHTIHPQVGRVFTEEIQQKDVALMKAANINAIRTSHNPPEQRFIDLCDEKGFYVICEVPFGGNGKHLDDPAYQEDLLTRADETVLRDRSHPSVIVWSIGNENPYTPLVEQTVKRVKTLDPTRPVCLPEMNAYAVKAFATLPDFIDILAPHYPSEKQLETWAQGFTRPVLATEFCHALGNAFEGLRPLWDTMLR